MTKRIALIGLFFSLLTLSFYIDNAKAQDQELCDIYDLKFLEYIHISFEKECSSKNLKKHRECRRILSYVNYFNKLRSKHCYGEAK